MNRRELIITGGACLIAAPAIVRIGSLMPVKKVPIILYPYQDLYPYQEEILSWNDGDVTITYSNVLSLPPETRHQWWTYGWISQ